MSDDHLLPAAVSLHRGKHLELLAQGHWEYATRPVATGAVAIVAITKDHRIVFVEQYRIPVGKRVVELPAGLVGDMPGTADEPLLLAAQRELMEETGYESAKWTQVTEAYSSPGLTDEAVTLFIAQDAFKTGPGGGDESESIVVHEVPLAEADAWLASRTAAGSGADLKLYVALYLARHANL